MLKREVFIFLLVGGLTVLIDLGVYWTLILAGEIDVVTAKGIGFVSGTIFAYLANKLWTFRHTQSPGNVPVFVLLYVFTLTLNVFINSLCLSFARDSKFSYVVSFVMATGFSAAINFLGMKFFVFKNVCSELKGTK